MREGDSEKGVSTRSARRSPPLLASQQVVVHGSGLKIDGSSSIVGFRSAKAALLSRSESRQ
jgi:hypothetical protein